MTKSIVEPLFLAKFQHASYSLNMKHENVQEEYVW